MEKVNHIVITRKEEKELKKLSRLFEIMCIDLPSIVSQVEGLKNENMKMQEEILNLKRELKSVKTENEKLINEKMKQISVNIQNSNAKDGASKKSKSMFNFEGSKIDEHF